jgi:flagellar motor protein MotB
MRYLGWIIALLIAVAGVAGYFIFYKPLERGYKEQEAEINMWTAKVAALEGNPIDTSVHPDTTLSNPDTTPVKVDARLIGTVSSDLLFVQSGAELTASGKAEIDKLLPALRSSTDEVLVMAHWDNVRLSSDRYPTNWELTSAQAASVARYLLAQGIDSKRLVPCGLSAARPEASNSTPEGRAKNRRVEIYLR